MIDLHIHSTYSIDGTSPPHKYVDHASHCGLQEIGFSEHVDLDPTLYGYNFLDYPHYVKTLKDLRKDALIPLRCGIEVSYQHHLENTIRSYTSKAAWDFVIGSVHEVNKKPMDHTFLNQSTPHVYFEEVTRLLESSTCDIVGHLEYFKRWGGQYTSREWKRDICDVLQLVIENDVALEVNTSGLRHPARDTYPSLEVLSWYKKLGGTLISLGSDAHKVEHMGAHFPAVIRTLTSLGFDTVVTFNKRALECVPL
jgi:histidinol-phosphatase (PHP family)